MNQSDYIKVFADVEAAKKGYLSGWKILYGYAAHSSGRGFSRYNDNYGDGRGSSGDNGSTYGYGFPLGHGVSVSASNIMSPIYLVTLFGNLLSPR